MWSVSISSDPLTASKGSDDRSFILNSCINLQDFIGNEAKLLAFHEGGHTARVSLADFVARQFVEQRKHAECEVEEYSIRLENLDRLLMKRRRRKQNLSAPYPPYILERTDFWCSENDLSLSVRMTVTQSKQNNSAESVNDSMVLDQVKKTEESLLEVAAKALFNKILPVGDPTFKEKLMNHVACTVLQHRIRCDLARTKSVAFIADGSILPRKSGTSDSPMSSPPAVPSKAPKDSRMAQSITVEMGSLAGFLPSTLSFNESSSITLSGLVVPAGITLICGGGYHGKSTLLNTIALGIYNKISGDGREFCVAVSDAVTVVSTSLDTMLQKRRLQ